MNLGHIQEVYIHWIHNKGINNNKFMSKHLNCILMALAQIN